MKFPFNPIAAYRQHGQRYSIYVATQLAVVVGLIALSSITVLGNFDSVSPGDPLYQTGLLLIKLVSIGMIYIAFEFLYWKVKFAGLQSRSLHEES